MLYAVLVRQGHGYFSRNPEPSASDGWEILDIKGDIDTAVWERRCDAAQGVEPESWSYCNTCGYEGDSGEWECPRCVDSLEHGEEEWNDHVESSTYYHTIPYDATNDNHARCPGVEHKRPEHKVAVDMHNKKVARRIERLETDLTRNLEQIRSLTKKRIEIRKELGKLQNDL